MGVKAGLGNLRMNSAFGRGLERVGQLAYAPKMGSGPRLFRANLARLETKPFRLVTFSHQPEVAYSEQIWRIADGR